MWAVKRSLNAVFDGSFRETDICLMKEFVLSFKFWCYCLIFLYKWSELYN